MTTVQIEIGEKQVVMTLEAAHRLLCILAYTLAKAEQGVDVDEVDDGPRWNL